MSKKTAAERVGITKEKLHEAIIKGDSDLYNDCENLAKIINDDVAVNDICVMCNNYTDTIVGGVPICDECHAKFSTQLKYARDCKGIPKLVNGVKLMLEGLKDLYDIDPNDDNFKDTPKRVARLMMEMNYGNNLQAAKDVLNVSFPTDNQYGGLVSSNNIHVSSLCPHHMLPVNYNISIAYVPNDGKYIGLSKLPRFVKTLAKSARLQEDLTQLIVDTLDKNLKPLGCAVIVTGVHNCVQCRGIEMYNVFTTTSALRGIFTYNPELKKEWLAIINNKV